MDDTPVTLAIAKPRADRAAITGAVLVLLAAALIRVIFPLDPNIDWLTSVARVVADGGRLGREIVETNPPMAVWLQMPAVLIERFTGWRAETVQICLVFALGVAAAEGLVRRIADLGGAMRFDRALIYTAFLAAPLTAYGEREHIAMLLTVPAIALTMRRAAGFGAPVGEIAVAGLAAALAAMVKPQFALPVMALAVLLCARRRSLLPLVLPEYLLAAAATLAYAAAVVVLVPAYVSDVLPVVLEIYRPVKRGIAAMLGNMATLEWLAALAALAWLTRRRLTEAVTAPFVAASAGFFIAFLEQGRGWPYHAFPAAALIALAVLRAAPAALASGVPVRRIAAVAGILACLMPLPNLGFFIHSPNDIVAAIRAARPAPRIVAITTDLTPGHPITTDSGGRWVGTHSSRWITVYAESRRRMSNDPEVIARCEMWQAFDRAAVNRDLAERRPDIVLVGHGGRDWHAWIAADPETARLMSNYRLLARQPIRPGEETRFEAVEAWIRVDLVTAAR